MVVVGGAVLGGCSTHKVNRAPVEDRSAGHGRSGVAPVVPGSSVVALPGSENAGKPGYYTVKPGDTLIHIGLENGQSARDIARWSGVENPNRIEVGQVLRVVPPEVNPASASAGVVVSPVARSAAAMQSSAAPAAVVPDKSQGSAGHSGPDEISWIWPTSGAVLAGFNEVKNKGLDIGGKLGDPVLAAADGRVVYVGAGLRGYGNLIILKHNNIYLTAYAHNQTLLIKEEQMVRKGQKIAEMGSSDADRVKLHFELRRQGKPVDPISYLPAR